MTAGDRVGGEQPLGVDRGAPVEGDRHDLGPAARRHVDHALSEHAVDADDHHVARVHHVDEGGLHAGRPGAADGQGEGVLRAEHGPEPLAGLVEQGDEVGVEVPEQGAGEAEGGLGVRVAGPGAHQDAVAERHGP
jgi:hypothetical protein